MERVEVENGIVCIRNVLSAAECEALIARAEAAGFEPATINTRSGAKRDERTRDNDRVIMDDAALASDLWKRVADQVPVIRAGRQVIGLNERLRFYRYHPGQRFDWHVDGAFRRKDGEMSLFTFMIYLNEGYRGGATAFHNSADIVGERGMALLFEHGLMHQGAEVTEGVKYALRSDVMYGPVGRLGG
jgi:predicted 2-oxoglutarate/Fe(II)-dependent dioxygenase YbiX